MGIFEEMVEELKLESSKFGLGTREHPSITLYCILDADLLKEDTAKILDYIKRYVDTKENWIRFQSEIFAPKYMLYPGEIEAVVKMGEYLARIYEAIKPFYDARRRDGNGS